MIARSFQLAAFFFLLAAVTLTGCGSKSGQPKRVALVVDAGGFGDRSFNDAANAGLTGCKAVNATQTDAEVPASSAEYGPKLTLLATENFDAVIGIGFAIAPDVAKAARRFENAHFAIIDATVDLANVESITFDEPQGSFLAGALAGMVSKTKTVAFLGGAEAPLVQRYEAGFAAGARAVDPRLAVRARYLRSFDDAGAGKSAAEALFGQGADIIYVVAGRSGLGAIEAVKARPHAYLIGVDSNQDALAPGKVLTSVVKRVDLAVLRVCLEANAQKPLSGHVVLGVADDGIGLTDFRYTRGLIGTAAIAHLERIRRALAAGTIVPPATPAQLAGFRARAVP